MGKWKNKEQVTDLGYITEPDVAEALRADEALSRGEAAEPEALCDLGEPPEDNDDAASCGDGEDSGVASLPQGTVIRIATFATGTVLAFLLVLLLCLWCSCSTQRQS